MRKLINSKYIKESTIQRDYKNNKNISEHCTNIFNENSRIDEANGLISGVCVFRRESKNNRIYSKTAETSLIGFLEGARCLMDHGNMFSGQSVGDLIGEFHNPRRYNGGVYADLEVLNNAKSRSLLFEIAENKPSLAGFSINARGKFNDATDSLGRDQVDDILALYSADWVSNPACTDGMYEEENKIKDKKNLNNNNNKDEGGVDNMLNNFKSRIAEFESLTEDGKEKAALDYVIELEKGASDLVQMKTEQTKLTEDVKSVKEDLEKVQEELKVKTIELDNFKTRDKKALEIKDRIILVDKILAEEKLDSVDAKGAFYDILLELNGSDENPIEDKIRGLIKDRKKHLKDPVVGMGTEQEEENKVKKSDKAAEWAKKTDDEKMASMKECISG